MSDSAETSGLEQPPKLPHAFGFAGGPCVHCRTPWSNVRETECPVRLRAQADILIQALERALGEGPDPGRYPDNGPPVVGPHGFWPIIRAATDADGERAGLASGCWSSPGPTRFRRTCAARRVLASIRVEVPRE